MASPSVNPRLNTFVMPTPFLIYTDDYGTTYPFPIGLDAEGIVTALTNLGVVTFTIWVDRSPYSWDAFNRIAYQVSRSAYDMQLWLSLSPPSENFSDPYSGDYILWMQEIARLSKRVPYIKGVNIDDFMQQANPVFFTPAYCQQMYKAKNAVNSALAFAPTLYLDGDFTADFVSKYGVGCLDGVWLAYTNLHDNAPLGSKLTAAKALASNRFPITPLIYFEKGATVDPGNQPVPSIAKAGVQTSLAALNSAVAFLADVTDPAWSAVIQSFH
jgi:hypothetical protein